MLSDVLSGLSNDSGIMGETQYTLDHRSGLNFITQQNNCTHI